MFWSFAVAALCFLLLLVKPQLFLFVFELHLFLCGLLCGGALLALTFALRLCAKSEAFVEDVLKVLLLCCCVLAPFLLNDALVYLSCVFYPGSLGWLGYGCGIEPINQPAASLFSAFIYGPIPILLIFALLFDFLFIYYAFARKEALRPIRLIFIFTCSAMVLSKLHDFSNVKAPGPALGQHEEMFFLGRYQTEFSYYAMLDLTDRLVSMPLSLLGMESASLWPGEFMHSAFFWLCHFFTMVLPDPRAELYLLSAYGPDPAGHPSHYTFYVGVFAAELFYCAVMWVFWFVFMRGLAQHWLLRLLSRLGGWWRRSRWANLERVGTS